MTKAAILRTTDGPYTIEDISLGPPRADEVVVRIVGAGMCHTDLLGRSGYLGDHFLPAVLGHEGSGVVEEVGSSVRSVAVGDHVVLSFDSCGECDVCLAGSPAYCLTFELRNLSGTRPDGTGSATDHNGEPLTSRWFAQSSFSEYVIATERSVVVIDQNVPLEQMGPLGCGIQTGAGAVLNEMKMQPGETIVIFGAGAVGLSAVMAAKLSGARDIVAVDTNPARRELAQELGATRAVDGLDADLVKTILEGTTGFDFSLDTTGVGRVMSSAIHVLARRGHCVLLGAGADEFSISPSFLSGKQVTYVLEGSSVPKVFIPRLVDFWKRGLFPFDRLIRTYSIDEINQAEADSISGHSVKPVFSFGANR